MKNQIDQLANRYLMHLAHRDNLPAPELAEAERAYVLWDWNGLALLAYEQFLKSGKGALVGPRRLEDDHSVTVVFDYIPLDHESLGRILDHGSASRLDTYLTHYHPEFDLVVVWLRGDGTTRYELFGCDVGVGLRAPIDLYLEKRGERSSKTN